MKVLAINGSPRDGGCTYTALQIVTDELQKAGIETETVHIGKEPLSGCTVCGGCTKAKAQPVDKPADKHCVHNDIVNECIEKMYAADGLLIGSPVYYGNIAGSMKCFLDRFFYAGAPLRHKAAAAVVSSRRAGGVEAYHQLASYLTLSGSIIVPTYYWNEVHGARPEDVLQDKEGVQLMEMLGKNMAWLLTVLSEGKAAHTPPAIENRQRTNFIR